MSKIDVVMECNCDDAALCSNEMAHRMEAKFGAKFVADEVGETVHGSLSILHCTNICTHDGTGRKNTYSYYFKLVNPADLKVTAKLPHADTTQPRLVVALTNITDYTITGVGTDGPGTVVFSDTGQLWMANGNIFIIFTDEL